MRCGRPIACNNHSSPIDIRTSPDRLPYWCRASSHLLERRHGRGPGGRRKAKNRPNTLQSGSDEPPRKNGTRLQTPSWMPLKGRGTDTFHSLDNCPQNHLIAPNPGDNSGTSPSDPFLRMRAKWQQRPETPVLISRIHNRSSHHTHHQCSDSAEESIRTGSIHQPPHKKAPHARPVGASPPTTKTPPTPG